MSAVLTRYADRYGERFGQLVFVRLSDVRGDNSRLLGQFKCDCGKVVVRAVSRLLKGKLPHHCGCLTDRGAHRTHGKRYTGAYASWQSMKDRCLNKTSKDYPRYGGAGITIHEPWIDSFEAFYEFMGPRPNGTSIDRIDTLKNYEPGNVRWATPTQQQRNRTTTFDWFVKGKHFATAQEAANHYNVSEHTVWRWVNGQMDYRRNKFIQPRKDCYVVGRY